MKNQEFIKEKGEINDFLNWKLKEKIDKRESSRENTNNSAFKGLYAKFLNRNIEKSKKIEIFKRKTQENWLKELYDEKSDRKFQEFLMNLAENQFKEGKIMLILENFALENAKSKSQLKYFFIFISQVVFLDFLKRKSEFFDKKDLKNPIRSYFRENFLEKELGIKEKTGKALFKLSGQPIFAFTDIKDEEFTLVLSILL